VLHRDRLCWRPVRSAMGARSSARQRDGRQIVCTSVKVSRSTRSGTRRARSSISVRAPGQVPGQAARDMLRARWISCFARSARFPVSCEAQGFMLRARKISCFARSARFPVSREAQDFLLCSACSVDLLSPVASVSTTCLRSQPRAQVPPMRQCLGRLISGVGGRLAIRGGFSSTNSGCSPRDTPHRQTPYRQTPRRQTPSRGKRLCPILRLPGNVRTPAACSRGRVARREARHP
jgi:hypothetical protein